MAICRYYQQGNCRNGDSCRFEHPGARTNSASDNRFSVFGSTAAGVSSSSTSGELPYHLSKPALQRDLTEELPPWILSSFGPGKDAPEQLFGGYPTEQSFEEVRLHHIKGVASGNQQGAVNEIESLYRDAQGRIQNALNNTDAAIEFIISAGNKHPNRLDVCNNNSLPGGTTGVFEVGKQPANPFGAPQQTQTGSSFGAASTPATTGAFGQSSALGAKPSPFGVPSFGQAVQPSGAFGQPSQLGSTSAFGQPAQLGATTSAFGKSQQLGGGGTAFGQTTQMGGGGSAFGQSSALGQKPNPFGAPAFGQASQPSGTTPAFGQATQPGSTGAFGQPAAASAGAGFGQTSALGQKPNPFAGGSGGASPFGGLGGGTSGSSTASPFGQAAQTTPSPFGVTPSAAGGQTGVFGQPAAPSASPFGQPSTTAATPSPFGHQQPAAANPFAQPKTDVSMDGTAAANPFGQPPAPTPAANPFQRPAAAPSAFGQPTTTTGSSAFGLPASLPATKAAVPAAAAAAVSAAISGQGNPYAPNATRKHPAVESYITRDNNNRLSTFKGKNVTYQQEKPKVVKATLEDRERQQRELKWFPVLRNFDGSFNKIWFPDGPPNYYKDTELEDGAYDANTKAAYEGFMKTGRFVAGMPELPPKREWCMFDF